METPVGTHPVLWKEEMHISGEYDGAPMPFSLFFTTHGMAIHAGRAVMATGGCVQLIFDDAEFWYKTLDVGDEIHFHGSADPAERAYHNEPGITSEAPYHS